VVKFYRLSSLTSILRRAGLAFACLGPQALVLRQRWSPWFRDDGNLSLPLVIILRNSVRWGNPSLAPICLRTPAARSRY